MTPKQPEADTPLASGQPGYQARYGGWNRRNLRVVLIALIFCAAAFLPTMPAWLRITDLVFFGGGMLLMLALSLDRPIALRMSADGITLCRSPLYRRSTSQTYPWPEVEQIVIWRSFSMDYVGVRRAPGASPLSGRFIGRASRHVAALTSGLPPDVAVTGVPANNWVLDRQRLAAAAAYFAPQVQVVDLTAARRPPAG